MSYKQTILDFDRPAGDRLAELGLELAVETAERNEKDWKKRTWQLFLWWLRRQKRHSEFQIEDFRKYLYDNDLSEPPPSEKAYGFISKKGVKEGWIEWSRMDKAKNKKAHSRPVNIWRKK